MDDVLSETDLAALRFDGQCANRIDALHRRIKSASTCLEFSHDRMEAAKTLMQIHEELLSVASACLKGGA